MQANSFSVRLSCLGRTRLWLSDTLKCLLFPLTLCVFHVFNTGFAVSNVTVTCYILSFLVGKFFYVALLAGK